MKADLHAHTHFSRDALTSVGTFTRRRAGRIARAMFDIILTEHPNGNKSVVQEAST
jgi:hypothetical protein